MSKQRMEHPEGHSDWVPAPAAGGSPHNDGTVSTSAPHPTPCGAGDMPRGSTSTHTKGAPAPGEYAHTSPLGESLEEDPSVNPIGEGMVWSRGRDLRIYSAALAVHTVMGVALGWVWHLADLGTNNDVWRYVLRWSCMAWVAAACVLVCVWLSTRQEFRREHRLMAEVYAAEAGLSSDDSALFVETVGKVS